VKQAVHGDVALAETAATTDRQRLAVEARMVGLREFDTPTLEAVERRRLQLWFLSIVILLGVSAIVTAGSIFPTLMADWRVDSHGSWFTGWQFRTLMLTLTFGFTAYTVDKERHLRRLTRLLVDERELTAALSNRLSEVSALLDAGKAINSVLELDAVLRIILNSATSLLRASNGSIVLAANDPDALRRGVAGRVARSWEPILVSDQDTPSGMCVPLVHRSELLGVLTVSAGRGKRFTEYDLRALSLFAEQAAAAIANARLYEQEQRRVAELVESENRKSEFLAGVSHDLRTPLTSLLGCTRMLQRGGLAEHHRQELAAMIDRQADRLNRMVEDLLAAARLENEQPLATEPIDVASLLRELAAEYAVDERGVTVDAPPTLVALARAEALRRIVVNLVDNAFKHGTPPVTVSAVATDDGVVVSVRDHGPGIARDDRERVFERFTRLDTTRTKPGIGLGLSIVQGLVASCQGDVWVDEPGDGGDGTVVNVRLRIA
jgi:two-component system sensor histidine kinase KdpD